MLPGYLGVGGVKYATKVHSEHRVMDVDDTLIPGQTQCTASSKDSSPLPPATL